MGENRCGFGRSGEMSDSPTRIKLRALSFSTPVNSQLLKNELFRPASYHRANVAGV